MPHYISKTRHIFSDRYILISLHEFGVLIYKWQEKYHSKYNWNFTLFKCYLLDEKTWIELSYICSGCNTNPF